MRTVAAFVPAEAQPNRLVCGHPALSLHSSNEPGELWQWLALATMTAT